MKKIIRIALFCTFIFGASTTVKAQESYGNALNVFASFGDNSSIGGFYEFTLAKNFTISPEVAIPFDFDSMYAGARVDYYFDSLVKLNEPWDIWGGVGLGFNIGNNIDDNLRWDLHIGGEYKFNEKWGIIAEFGGGSYGAGFLGVGIHL